MCGSMPKKNQYQQKAQVHRPKINTCSFSCPLNPSVDTNSTVHSDFTRQWQKDIHGSTINTVTEVEFSKHDPPYDPIRWVMLAEFSKNNDAAQVGWIQCSET